MVNIGRLFPLLVLLTISEEYPLIIFYEIEQQTRWSNGLYLLELVFFPISAVSQGRADVESPD